MRKQPSINEIEKITEELIINGGNPDELYELLQEYEFTPTVIKITMQRIMENNYHVNEKSIRCKHILEYELMVLSKSALKI